MAVFSAIGAAIGAVATWATTTAVGQLVGGMALNALASALFAPDSPSSPGAQVQTQIQQGIVPRSFIVGRTATAGSLVYHTTMGVGADDETENYVAVFALSDMPVKALTGLWIDGQKCTVDGSAGVDAEHGTRIPEIADDDGQIKAWFRFYNGHQTAADQRLIDQCSTSERPWSAQHIGRGVAYIVMICDYDSTLYQGRPSFLFELDGIDIYDPSTDSTGPANDLPAAQIHRVLKSVSYGGQWLYGPQHQAIMDPTVWSKAITDCRLPVPGASAWSDAKKREAFGSTTVPARYRSGLQVSVDRPVADVIEDLASACNGRFSEVAGAFRFQVGNPPAAPDFTFTDADILTTREQSFTPFLPLAETVNAVAATYPDPEQQYEEQEAPPLYVPAYEAEDGNRRLTTTARLSAVPYREQVQRLQKGALDEARRARRHTIVMPPKFWVVEPGDYGSWNSARNGYIDKMFRVDGVSDEPNGDVVLDMTEVDPSDYDFDADDYVPVVSGSIVQPGAPVFYVQNWAVTSITSNDASGVPREAGIQIEWSTEQPGRGIKWRVFYAGTDNVAKSGSTSFFEAGRHEIFGGIRPETNYEVQGARIVRNGKAQWSARLPVTTASVVAAELDDEVFERLGNDFRNIADRLFGREIEDLQSDDLKRILDEHETREETLEEGARAVQDLREQVEQGVSAEAVARQELAAKVATNVAQVTSEQIARVTQDRALARDITALSATVAGNNATVTQELSAVATATNANASAITNLSTTVGDQNTSISQVIESIDGIEAQYAVRINNNGHVSGFGLLSGSGTSAFVVQADKFGIVAPNGIQQTNPFFVLTTPQVIDGVTVPAGVYIAKARIGEAWIGTSNIEAAAVSETFSISGDGSYSFYSPSGGFVIVDLFLATNSGSGDLSYSRCLLDGSTIGEASITQGESQQIVDRTVVRLIGPGNHTLSIESLNGSTRNARAVNVKR